MGVLLDVVHWTSGKDGHHTEEFKVDVPRSVAIEGSSKLWQQELGTPFRKFFYVVYYKYSLLDDTLYILALSLHKDYTDDLQTNANSWAMRMTFIAIHYDFSFQHLLSDNNY
jgi:hypothetical protein